MDGEAREAFRGRLREDEVEVEFGRPGAAGTVAVGERIVMPVETARRLMVALAEVTRSLPPEPAPDDGRGETPVNAPPDPAGEKAALLLRLVGALGVPYQHERSFRLAPGSLQANRFLLSV